MAVRVLPIGVVVILVAGGLATPAAATAEPPVQPDREAILAGETRSGGAATTADVAAGETSILINELSNGGPGSDDDSFFELRNWGDTTVDLSDWHIFRCSWQGLRSNDGRPEAELGGVTLRPGEIYTVSKIGMPGDAHLTQPLASTGFGLYLENPAGELVDAVGVYPNEPWPTTSECTLGQNLPNVLDSAAGETYQRVGTGPLDYVVAAATLGAQNTTTTAPLSAATVSITEVAGSGPGGSADDFVELENTGTRPVDLGGFELWRCTATGRLGTHQLQLTVAEGTTLGPGERWVAGGPGFDGADATYATQLSDVQFGALLRDAAGALVDRVAVSSYADSACQGEKLRAVLDPVAGESWQRTDAGWIIAPRTPGTPNRATQHSVFLDGFDYPEQPGVAISEVATDPAPEGMPAGSIQRNWIELANYGDHAVDISGWTARRCEADGQRATDLQFTVPEGTTLEPGTAYLAARSGTEAAADADTTYEVALNLLGTGVWIEDAQGRRVDSVGIYAANEMDSANVIDSPCTKGAALTTYQPDRLEGETFQRTQFTGNDIADFVVGAATPGEIDLVPWVGPTARTAPIAPAGNVAADPRARTAIDPAAGAATPVVVLEAWSGVADALPLAGPRGPSELPLAPGSATTDDGFGFPYQRFVIEASAGAPIAWSGTTAARNELQLMVWSGDAWRLMDAGEGELSAVFEPADVVDGRANILIVDGPRTQPTIAEDLDGQLQDPADYDFAITHITDTQYLSESYPEVYAQLVSWIADNADDRKIAFATHTGDLVQNWVDPAQNEVRARIEFERASAIQGILAEAGVPNSVLPGNHDNKRGITNELFNEYFGPERYEGSAWYGGSIAPGDNSSNFSTFEQDGTWFLMLSLPYAYGQREIDWAGQVVAAHPDHNVIVSTHEHLTPKMTDVGALRVVNSRWTSHAQDLWDQVIAPNRNVVAVLCGHFHGLGQIVTENAGGIEGHTVVELLADYQEFRTHTGERATGFFRMLQFDIDQGAIAVDTRSLVLQASAAWEYDYRQFVPDNGTPYVMSNVRPWRILDAGLQNRYTDEDDEFTTQVTFQHPKVVQTGALLTQ